MADYDFRGVEHRWQQRWEDDRTYRTRERGEKYYVLVMLPYPSGDLHIGHAKNYTIGDAIARMMRMLGYDVVHPMGWDAFGLPAENAAIARGIDPAEWTLSNIKNMQRQIRLMGTGYDWSREIATCTPEYYRWNQWLFLRLYEAGLAYKRQAPVNWCPNDQTVLANEQVIDGRCWRCDALVERRNLSQWFLKITDYADRLLNDLDTLNGWPERTKAMQRNWIGRSEGTQFSFGVENIDAKIDVFTTRVDTAFGVTFLAVAPEHSIVQKLLPSLSPDTAAQIAAFAESLKSKSELERTSLMEKQGLFTGVYAINPLSNERVPIWVTNYVLAEYGTGAVMGVPAHDERDFIFAQQYHLPINQVIVGPTDDSSTHLVAAFLEDGLLVNSGVFSGMTSADARLAMTKDLQSRGIGGAQVNFRVRDWLVSRQRYWGTPIPILTCERCGELAVPDDQLPIVLPSGAPITGEGSPLARLPEFINTPCPKCGGPARRESDTMDTFFESSWYYLRYLDPHNETAPWSVERATRWMNVDQYIGGAEHAVLHLLYSRFFYKFFADHGWVGTTNEPFERLFHQGMVLYNGEKMSKSRGNVIGIDLVAEQHGVDAMRLFLLYVTPPEDTSDWSDDGMSGRVRFVARVWRICEPFLLRAQSAAVRELPTAETSEEKTLLRAIHTAAKSAIDETLSRRFHYNATIAKLDEYMNALSAATLSMPDSLVTSYAIHALPLVLAPFAPHLAEELWAGLGHTESVHLERALQPDPRALKVDEITLVVQVNGKIRARVPANPGLSEEHALALAHDQESVQTHLAGKTVLKTIYVPDKLVNIVAT